MKKLLEIRKQYEEGVSAEKCLKEIFDTYLLSEKTLEEHNLDIVSKGYGIYALYQEGEYLMDGERTSVQEHAKKIIDREVQRRLLVEMMRQDEKDGLYGD